MSRASSTNSTDNTVPVTARLRPQQQHWQHRQLHLDRSGGAGRQEQADAGQQQPGRDLRASRPARREGGQHQPHPVLRTTTDCRRHELRNQRTWTAANWNQPVPDGVRLAVTEVKQSDFSEIVLCNISGLWTSSELEIIFNVQLMGD